MKKKNGRQILKEKTKKTNEFTTNNNIEGDGVAIYRVSSLRQDAEG